MSQILHVIINGTSKEIPIEPDELLLDVLRREGYKGVKRGCKEGTCGTCTILLNDKAVKSCILLAAQAKNCSIITIEGIGTRDNPHPIQQAFVDEGVVQCGFCIPGMILSAKNLLDNNPNPTKDEVKMALDGNLCRCTGYSGQIKAVLAAAPVMRGEK
ncbi:(2Fe-2S)-binding protein [Candidatus Heimdallarchaeota archaeon B3_Heim]|nr:MAG: (2Fe-2S)-binding protein [Candidatus Heimdallarchaeota archaeon B3_Heim]